MKRADVVYEFLTIVLLHSYEKNGTIDQMFFLTKSFLHKYTSKEE